jgi:hypothetical protein
MRLTEMGMPEPGESDMGYDLVDDVVVFMRNDKDFYRRQYYPAMSKISRNYKKTKKIDRSMATDMIKNAVPAYCKAFNIKKAPAKLFTKEDMDAILDMLFDEESDEIRNGEYL